MRNERSEHKRGKPGRETVRRQAMREIDPLAVRPDPSRQRLANLLLAMKFTLGCAIVYWLVTTDRLDPKMYGALVAPSRATLIGAVALSQATSLTILLSRWWLLLRAQGIRMSFWESLQLSYQGTFMGLFIPGALGTDGLRALYLRRHYRKHLAAGLASIALDRVVGFVGLLILAVGFGFFYMLGHQATLTINLFLWMLGTLTVVSIILAAACGYIPLKGLGFLRKAKWLAGFVDALAIYGSRHKTLALVIGMSVAGHLLVIVGSCLGLAAMGIEFSTLAVATVTPALIVIRFIPLTPLGLGLSDMAGEELYNMVGLAGGAENQMLLRAVWVVLLLICGLSFFGGRHSRTKRPSVQ